MHFGLCGVVYWKPIQQKLTSPGLLFGIFAGWVLTDEKQLKGWIKRLFDIGISLSLWSYSASGILKNVNATEGEPELDEEGVPVTSDTELEESAGNHACTQLNGPVIDPTFSGRGNQASTKIPFGKGKKKPVSQKIQKVLKENLHSFRQKL